MISTLTGIEVFKEGYWKKLKGYRLALLSNQASVDNHLCPSKEVVSRLLGDHLKLLLGPQHGHEGLDQDNMVETAHGRDKRLGIPVFSLYSSVREPTREMLDLFDILLVDLQDVGTRVYTFATTVLNCLKATARAGKRIIILDRPNPLGGRIVEGNLLRPELYSFVGPYSLPMRHGLTMGEIASMLNQEFKIGSDLEIVPLRGWQRHMLWRDTGLRWIMPSPNMPLWETAQVYPGQVIWEGTNLSEGRGTCRPFEIFGAPYLDTMVLRKALDPDSMAGCFFQEISFRPTFNKWSGEICSGFMIHVLDPEKYSPYYTALSVLRAVIETHEKDFQWKEPPYEYEFEKLPIDLIIGDTAVRREIEKGASVEVIREKWKEDLRGFSKWREAYLLYG
ncbi:MAG: DUF1343 domain-containing protein [Deltaproteobacteria bacterium]|nr:DUF1343 domain-containing protein [Deltaproteobacteria bacterium]